MVVAVKLRCRGLASVPACWSALSSHRRTCTASTCAQLLTPLYDLMVKRVLLSTVIHTDDTTVPVFDPTLPKTRTGRFWVYIGDVRNPYVVYDYTPRRTRDGPERFLKGFCGYLQADALSGYDRI